VIYSVSKQTHPPTVNKMDRYSVYNILKIAKSKEDFMLEAVREIIKEIKRDKSIID